MVKSTITDIQIADAVTLLLEYIGEDPSREGLKGTPERVGKAFHEMTRGYRQDPVKILSTQFSERSDEIVMLKGIRFTSLCEHHLLPFVGVATVGYLPGERVVGLSKLARLVHAYSKRLQIQERLTTQIAQALLDIVQARGAGVIIEAQHQCMACRGVEQLDAVMVTSAMLGEMRTNAQLRSEFLSLAK